MKNITLFLLLGLASLSLKAQNLTMAQLLQIKKMNLAEAEEYLTARGWEFSEAIDPTDSTMGTAMFAYRREEFDSSIAQAWFLFFYSDDSIYSDDSNATRVSIGTSQKSKYNEYLNAIKSYGCRLLSSKVKDGALVKVYRGATTTFRIKSVTDKRDISTTPFDDEKKVHEHPAWNFSLFSNDNYDLNYSVLE